MLLPLLHQAKKWFLWPGRPVTRGKECNWEAFIGIHENAHIVMGTFTEAKADIATLAGIGIARPRLTVLRQFAYTLGPRGPWAVTIERGPEVSNVAIAFAFHCDARRFSRAVGATLVSRPGPTGTLHTFRFDAIKHANGTLVAVPGRPSNF